MAGFFFSFQCNRSWLRRLQAYEGLRFHSLAEQGSVALVFFLVGKWRPFFLQTLKSLHKVEEWCPDILQRERQIREKWSPFSHPKNTKLQILASTVGQFLSVCSNARPKT